MSLAPVDSAPAPVDGDAVAPPTMERLLTLIASGVALAVALLLPGVAAFVGHQSQSDILRTEAEINARLVSQLVSVNPELWKEQTPRLEELLRRRPADHTPEARTVLDLTGQVVGEVRDELPAPLLSRRHAVHDAGEVVAMLQVQRSLRPLLLQAGWLALLGGVLGTGIFVALRLLPLRALRAAQARLVQQATHDALTGLPNRLLFRDRLAQAMDGARRTGRPMALLYLDLDNFKDVNDSLGHEAGDEVLRQVARLLSAALPAARGGAVMLARLGGDEFTAVVEGLDDAGDGGIGAAATAAERLLAALRQPVRAAGAEVTMLGSLGLALYPQPHADADTLLRQADMAMYRAKELGRNTYNFFDEALAQTVQRRIALDRALRGALERGEFLLHYQPKADLASGRVVGVEALLRWQRPGQGLVPPDSFIGMLEENRLIVPVGDWVIATACAQLAAWDRAGLGGLTMAVNLSARQFREAALPERLEQVLAQTGIAPRRLELELTESLLMEDSAGSRAVLDAFARIGVRVAIDDFGTGHSSLAYLKRFAVDTLKIDCSFVRDVPQDADNCAIATAVVALARSMKLEVVCEGVEAAEQVAFLRTLGCDAVQGFRLARPMPAAVLDDWLRRYRAGDAALLAWQQADAAPPQAVPAAATPADVALA